ncbi:MAG: 16S rRNA (guanine(966)-N(2))-methyltransferase RsmD [Emergencia sp.]
MRIITGEYRGRRLESPAGYDVRPTSDKVKEAVFNIIMNEVWDATCVDLFAGTGNLGLEALSRGAKKCYFGDNSRESINLIKNNVKMCRAEDKSVIIAGDYSKTLGRINEKVDIFFLDPPYKDGLYENCLEIIDSLDLLSEEGIIVAEHGVRDYVPETVGNLEVVKERKYGKIMVTIYARKSEVHTEEEEANE